MPLPDFNQLLNNKLFLSALSAVVGGFFGNLITVLRGRIRTLEYTVMHDRVAFSANDANFGTIQVTWQKHNVTNLFTSRIELINQTGTDLGNLRIKVYTGDTLLLGERTEITGTTHILRYTDEFARQLQVPQGESPSEGQFNIYNHSREYVVPVINRGQSVVMTYLTNVPVGTEGPAAWLDMLHQGVRLRHRPIVPQVHGVPTRIAVAIGLAAGACALVLTSWFLSEAWAAALICLVVGLFSRNIGAFLYRGFLLLKSIIVR